MSVLIQFFPCILKCSYIKESCCVYILDTNFYAVGLIAMYTGLYKLVLSVSYAAHSMRIKLYDTTEKFMKMKIKMNKDSNFL